MSWKHFLRWQSNSWHFASLGEVFKASDYKIFNATPYPPGILVKRNDDSGQGGGGFFFIKRVHAQTNTHTHKCSFIKFYFLLWEFLGFTPVTENLGHLCSVCRVRTSIPSLGEKNGFLFAFFKICKRFPSIPGHQHSVFKLGRSGKKFTKDKNCSK